MTMGKKRNFTAARSLWDEAAEIQNMKKREQLIAWLGDRSRDGSGNCFDS